MDRPTRGTREMSFKGLKLAFDRMDHGDGRQGKAGNWEILLGGYDMGYEIYYQGKPIGRVNYELGEYELYLDDLISRSELPMFLDAIDATGFKNVHDHGDEETCLESKRKQTMKKLNITKEAFEKSRYFTKKYGKLEYVSESGKMFKTNKGKVLKFKEAIMGGGEYEPSYDDDEEPLAEWKVGDRVNIDVWQVQWEYDDDDLADLPKAGWKIVNVERDENYDDCDGYCYTIVNIRNPKLKVEVSSSALVERKSLKKSGGKLKESTKKFGRKFTEADGDIPVTEQEKLLCQYIQDEIEGELNDEMGLNLTCGCNWHNPGEEQHIEIFVGIPEGEDSSDPKYDNIETFLEQFVNKIGGEENEGQKWGDASFQWISDEEVFGELWPLGGEVKESTKKFGRKFMKESCDEEFDRYYERMKNIFRYDSGIHTRLRDNEDGSETIEVTFDDRYQWDDDVESGKIPLDKDSRLEHWISRFDDAGHRNGWEFDYEIAKDIEHPIDGGANNDYLAMLTLTCKCDKEDDLLFENSSESTDDMEKEFTYKGISITRYDYESLPSPMAASKLSDEQMQEIAKDIYFELVNKGWDEKEIQKYVNNVDDYELPDAEMRIADKIRSDWWEAMEDVARYHGMEYYEDMPEEEKENYTESKKARFGKKFRKMDESMNWNGVTDKFIDNDKVQFTRKCPSCGKPHSITVSIRDVEDGCAEYGRGARIQDAFPNFSPDEREFFMSGICPDCWENM